MKQYLKIIAITSAILLAIYAIAYFSPGIKPLKNDHNGLLGATITTINGTDRLTDSRTTINNNFTALNNGKIENSTTSLPLILSLSGLTYAPSLNWVGTIATGTWNGSTLTVSYGGTGSSTLASKQLLIGNGTSSLQVIGFGTAGQFLTSSGTDALPYWSTASINEAGNYTWTGSSTFNGTTTFGVFPSTPNSYPTASTSVSNKGYVDSNIIGVSTSTNLMQSADTTRSKANDTNPTKIKEIEAKFVGKYRVSFDMRKTAGAGALAAIYRNGVAYGITRQNLTTTFETYTEDLYFSPGDYIQLYYWNFSADGGSNEVKNFRIYGSVGPLNLSDTSYVPNVVLN